MSQRFFLEEPLDLDSVRLGAAEARHLAKVMRAQVGDRVTLFDGSGLEFTAEVTAIQRSRVDLEIVQRQAVDREADRRLTIGVALPKGDRQRWLVEKLVECGAATLVPLRADRGVAQPVPAAVERLRRAVIEASKQCGRNRLMDVADPVDLADFLRAAPAQSTRWFTHTSEPSGPANPVPARLPAEAKSIHAAVGPEGGWTDSEAADAAELGWQIVTLGPRILRVETAALVVAVQATL